MKIVDGMLKLKEQAEALDVGTWQYLSNILQTLGKDGMSSEESDDETHEDIEPGYRPSVLPWRRDIEDELGIIDNQRHVDQDLFSSIGAKPWKRWRSPRNQESRRGPKTGLPRSFYRADWIDAQPESYLRGTLKPSEEPFQWMKV